MGAHKRHPDTLLPRAQPKLTAYNIPSSCRLLRVPAVMSSLGRDFDRPYPGSGGGRAAREPASTMSPG